MSRGGDYDAEQGERQPMTQREISRQEWTAGDSIQAVNCGSFQRIADACEKMAASYDAVRTERDSYRKWWEEGKQRAETLERRVNALRGVITKLRRKAGTR